MDGGRDEEEGREDPSRDKSDQMVEAPDGRSAEDMGADVTPTRRWEFFCLTCKRGNRRFNDFSRHLLSIHGVVRIKGSCRTRFCEGDQTVGEHFYAAADGEADLLYGKWRAMAAARREERRGAQKSKPGSERRRGRPRTYRPVKDEADKTRKEKGAVPLKKSRLGGKGKDKGPGQRKTKREGQVSPMSRPRNKNVVHCRTVKVYGARAK